MSAQVPLATPTVLPSVVPEPSDASSIPTVPPTPTAAPRHGRHRSAGTPSPDGSPSPEPTATPTSPAFSTLDGTWEVQVQSIAGTAYSHFTLRQDGSTITGTWLNSGQKWTMTGTYDGRLFRFVVTTGPATLNLTGYVENSTDMVGIVDNGKGEVPYGNPLAFTAEHRAAYKALENRPRKGSKSSS